jgi:ParB/RepB/Spo0J family partition protein
VADVKQGELDNRSVATDKLHPNPWNPNRMDDRTLQAERESIATFGFVDPITVRPLKGQRGHFQIIDGEHRWKCASEEGRKKVPCVVLDLGDTAAKKLTIVLNETRGQADTALLSTLLVELKEELGEDLGTGLRWSEKELDSILSVADDDWSKFDPDGLDDDPPNQGEFTTLQVRVPNDFLPVWEQAVDQVKDEGAELDPDKRVANGQVLMRSIRSALGET